MLISPIFWQEVRIYAVEDMKEKPQELILAVI